MPIYLHNNKQENVQSHTHTMASCSLHDSRRSEQRQKIKQEFDSKEENEEAAKSNFRDL